MNETATPGAAVRSWQGDDFPTWMNPMLVKELRQGVQSGVFAWTFVILHAAMFLLMTVWLVTIRDDQGASMATNNFYHGLFWTLFAAAAVLVVPARAAGSMAAERQGLALDLLRLTRLSSVQIVLGKWLGTMAQVMLLATSVLPYLVLQYFFGGLDFVFDMAAFVLTILAAAVMTGISLSLARQPPLLRLGVPLAVGYFLLLTGGMGLPSLYNLSSFGLAIIVASLVTAVLLEYAAAAIAPAAENHAGRIRLLVLVAVAVAVAATRFAGPGASAALVVVASTLAMGVAMAELTTDASPVRSLHAPFARLGALGRIAAGIFTPGWATSVPFLLVALVPLALAFSAGVGARAAAGVPELLGLAVAVVLLPLPVMLFFAPGRRRALALLLTHVIEVAVFALASASRALGDVSGDLVTSFLPLPALFRVLDDPRRSGDFTSLPAIAIAATCLVPVVPLWLREMAALGRRLGSPPPSPPGPRGPGAGP